MTAHIKLIIALLGYLLCSSFCLSSYVQHNQQPPQITQQNLTPF